MTRGGFFGVIALVLAVFGGALAAGSAEAGQPQPWQLGFQVAASPTMEGVRSLHDQILMPIITAITIFVLALLLFVVWRFRASRNPTPSRTVHNTTIEVIWTVIPVMILVVIAIPSFRLLYMADRLPPDDVELTLKAVGHQWFWSYEYPDQGFTFEAYMVPDQDLEEGQPRLLATDNVVVLPVETNIQFLTTASDVLHSWAIPAFGVKLDSVPGRLNETWFRINGEFAGRTFYGQCSELCGTGHAYMPIEVRAVTREEFDAWVAEAQEQFTPLSAVPSERERRLALLAD